MLLIKQRPFNTFRNFKVCKITMRKTKIPILILIIALTSSCPVGFLSNVGYEELWYSQLSQYSMVTGIANFDGEYFYVGESNLYTGEPYLLGALLYKVDLNGELIWKVNLAELIAGKYEYLDSAEAIFAFSIVEDQLMIGTQVGNPYQFHNAPVELFSISKATGELNWHYRMEEYSGNAELQPLLYKDFMVAVSDTPSDDIYFPGTTVHVLSRGGELLIKRRYAFTNRVDGLNYAYGNRLYSRGSDYDIVSWDLDRIIDPAFGDEECLVLAVPYDDDYGVTNVTDFVCYDNNVIYGNSYGVICRDADTGETVWFWEYPKIKDCKPAVWGTISFDEERLFVPLSSGLVVCLEKRGGKEIWSNNGSLEPIWIPGVSEIDFVRSSQRGIILEDKWFIHGFEQMLGIVVYNYKTGRKLLGIPDSRLQSLPIQHLFFQDGILYVVERKGLRAFRIFEK